MPRTRSSPGPQEDVGKVISPRPRTGSVTHPQHTTLPLPHERDEGTGHQATDHQVAGRPDPVIEEAKRNLDDGQVDTDMRATPGLDAQRRERLLQPDTPSADTGVGPRR